MKRFIKMSALLMIIFLASFTPWAAAASNAEADGKTYLLSIGINDYKYLASMKASVNNAEMFAGTIREINKAAEITVLTDGQATRSRIIAALEEYCAKSAEGDRLIIFYSGHGGKNARQYRPQSQYDSGYNWRDNNNIYDETIFPADAGYDLRSQITFSDIAGYIKKLKNVDIAVITDCAYSTENDWLINAPRTQAMTQNIRPRTSLRDLNIYGATVIDAADWSETATVEVFSGRMYGVFTYYFIQGIKADAIRHGKTGTITLSDAFAFARTMTLQEIGLQHPRIYRGKNPFMPIGGRQ